MDDIDRMRDEIKKASPNAEFWNNMIDEMPSNLITEVYNRLWDIGKLGK